mmetsp:Transcript_9438/g.23166  ORF Transcript_9438/g.23166 Transcript_9438/m.23166 type:complete len:499 (+) Transcript_9438:198-1694(+)
MTIPKRGSKFSPSVRASKRWGNPRSVLKASQMGQVTLLYVMAMAAFVAALQTPSPQQYPGNSNSNYNNGQQQSQNNINIFRSKTVEPRTTEFPKTSYPEDGNGSMFSPMDRNGPRNSNKRSQTSDVVKSIWETSAPILVEASSLHTVDFEKPSVERVQVLLKKSDMDPFGGSRKTTREALIARVDLWHGPDSTPQNLAIYLEDEDDDDFSNHDPQCQSGNQRTSSNCCDTPFSTIIETPHGHNTIAIRNIAESSDLLTYVKGEENEKWYTPSSPPSSDSPLQSVIQRLKATTTPQRIDSTTARKSENEEENNKAVVGSCTVELPAKVASVQVLLQTDFMQPIQARIELELRMTDHASLGSNNYRVIKRTIVEVYSEDGMHRPFFAIVETPRKTTRKSRLRQTKGEAADVKESGWFENSNAASYTTNMKVVNLSTTEFPLFATVEPHAIDDSLDDNEDENSSFSEQSGVEEDGGEWKHFGGGSNYDLNSNSTILDAEIL